MNDEDIEMREPVGGLQRLIFVRHGDRLVVLGKKIDQLSPLGFAQSRVAGVWLKERGLVPGIVLRTSAKRTLQTAEALLVALGEDVQIVEGRPQNGWGSRKDPGEACNEIDGRLSQWLSHLDTQDKGLLFVGHHPSHRGIVKAVGQGLAALEQHNNGAVIVCRRGDRRWELEDWFPGGAS